MPFPGNPAGAINSDPITTKVGTSLEPINTATSTQVTQGTDGKVNGGTTTLYYSPAFNNYIPAATTTDGGKTWTYLKDSNGNSILGADAQKSLEQGALKTNTQEQIQSAATSAGVPKEQQKTLSTKAQNTATSTDTTGKEDNSADPNKYDAEALASNQNAAQKNIDDMSTAIGEIGRQDYPDLRYPEEMDTKNQDYVQFSILKYEPSGFNLSNASTSTSVANRKNPTSNPIGTVTMAIQGPISDTNSVGWNDGNMSPIQALGAVGALALIGDGTKGGKQLGTEIGALVSEQNKALSTASKAFFAGQANLTQDVLTRTTGAIANPNIELLFNAPQLREFTFTFILSPRSESESTMVRKIIRFFKQGMSVKRASSGLFLKTPNTFLIKYMQKGDNPKDGAKYLPKIKECALQNFTVDYTPAQTYSTFYNNSMTAYQLTMGFKELIPIYNDDYTALDGNSDDYIGY